MTLYRTARNVYQRIFNRAYWGHRQEQKAFYSEFVGRGMLVFDIGANLGEVSGTFLDLGARVVAVEPNPELARELARRYGSAVAVENAAVGAEPGTAELNLGRDHGHSTLSEEWLDRAPTDDRWAGTVTTEVTTLDALIEKHGRPGFVKIDVEAYEAEVLSGLTGTVPALCFEYQGAYPEIAARCLTMLGAGYEYALTSGEEPGLTTGWVDADGALAAVRATDANGYGDVFARRLSG